MRIKIYLSIISVIFLASCMSNVIDSKDEDEKLIFNPDDIIINGTVKDIDGNIYKTIVLNNLEWMSENLKTTRYNDGIEIIVGTEPNSWKTSKLGLFGWYDTIGSNYKQYSKEKFGALYNFYAVKTNKLCPTGWRMPSSDDFNELKYFLDNDYSLDNIAGGMLKHADYWYTPNVEATNISQFSGLPTGRINEFGNSEGIGLYAYFWTMNYNARIVKILLNNESHIKWRYSEPNEGFCIRCVRDHM